VQVRFETATEIVNVRVLVTPYPVAERVTPFVVAASVPELTVNVAELAPVAILTDVGAVSGAVPDTLYDCGAKAALTSVTVQLALELLLIICAPDTVGREQDTDERGAAGTTERLAVCTELPKDAWIAAVWLLATAEVVPVTFADEAPAGTVTVAGTVTTEILEASATRPPPVGAGPESEIIQMAESPPATVPGAHPTEDTEGG